MDVLRARNRCQNSLLRRCFSKFSISFIHIRRVDQPALVMWYPLKKKDTRFVPSLHAWLTRYCLYSMYFLYPEPEDTLMYIRFSCCPHQVLGIIMITRHARTDDCLREVFFSWIWMVEHLFQLRRHYSVAHSITCVLLTNFSLNTLIFYCCCLFFFCWSFDGWWWLC